MESQIPNPNLSPFETLIVSTTDSPELSHLRWALRHSSVVALDAEWKPTRTRRTEAGSEPAPEPAPALSFPTVTLLQIACRVEREESDRERGGSPVFLVDLMAVPLESIWEILSEMFVSPSVLKLGFRFKQDLLYLSSTFAALGGFDMIEPFLDITSIYHHLRNPKAGKKFPKETKSLAAICEEMLKISLSKELQCSDWSCRPLTAEQISYAAADAYYLLAIFAIFEYNFCTKGLSSTGMQCIFVTEENMSSNLTEMNTSSACIGLKEILTESSINENVLMAKFCKASDMVKSTASEMHLYNTITPCSGSLCRDIVSLGKCMSNIIRKYGEKLLLKEADRKPRASRRKGRKQPANSKFREPLEDSAIWQGMPPWDPSVGGDGCPKFLCDAMVEGLARHLRCVGIDAAISSFKKPEPRQLLDQAYKEKRVVLTRDLKLLKHQIRNQVYSLKNLLKNDQLLEMIDAVKHGYSPGGHESVSDTNRTRFALDTCKTRVGHGQTVSDTGQWSNQGGYGQWEALDTPWIRPKKTEEKEEEEEEKKKKKKKRRRRRRPTRRRPLSWQARAAATLTAQVIEAFQLKISEDQLMSRCTKCNGSFIQKPLTMEEAIEASKGFQVIPSCLFNRNIEFWQCIDCHQLYWEGTQYHNAVQKFVTVCKLNE